MITVLIILALVVIINALTLSQLGKQVRRQQRQLDLLCEQTGNPALSSTYLSEETGAKAARLKAAGDIGAAVKAVREDTILDLLEAKQYVDKP
ncbi:MAG: 50S ribosomal protein L7/L12 [Clostridiales bacterium]|nr:50S ribosomal protein L7/L12 [Clostridiales bacterium]